MRKYLVIFKSELMTDLAYVVNLFANFIGFFIHIFIFLFLWKYMYSSPDELINGYTMLQMVWYVIITEYVWSVSSTRSFVTKISNEVKSGDVTYKINKPFSYIGYLISSKLGSSFIKAIIYGVLSIILGFILLGSFPLIKLSYIPFILLSVVLAIVVSILIVIIFGLFSFFIEDSAPFFWIYTKLILICGVVFPIEYFPSAVQPLLSYSPVFAISYAPAKLFVDFSWGICAKALVIQFAYVIVAYLLCRFIYKKGEKKLNVNGG